MATTLDVICDRVRSLCVAPPFGFFESPDVGTFERVPEPALAQGAFAVGAFRGATEGGMDFTEERFDTLDLMVARLHGPSPAATTRALYATAQSLVSAITRDGLTGGGDFGVLDEGGSGRVEMPAGAAYQVLRLTVPLTYMAHL